MTRMTLEQLARDFHETTHNRYRNQFRLISRITTRRNR